MSAKPVLPALLAGVFFLVGCGALSPALTSTATLAATEPPSPTITSTPSPSDTPEPTATERPTQILLQFTRDAFCRIGPGTAYHDTGSFQTGDTALADGRSVTEPRWLWVRLPGTDEHCWVSDFTIEPDPAVDALPVQEEVLPLPAPPPSFTLRWRDCTPGAIGIKLDWLQSPDADGYVLYFNGEETFRPLQRHHSYEHNPEAGQSLYYELAAVNKVGYSERLGLGVEACP